MGQCLGACFKEVPKSAYDKQIRKIKRFLNGDISQVKQDLTEKMTQASMDLEFERAAEFRDQLKYIEQTVEKQKIISNDHTQRDILTFMLINHGFRFKYFFLRQAKLLRRETRLFPLTDTNEPQDAFVSFIAQFYGQKKSCFTQKKFWSQLVFIMKH